MAKKVVIPVARIAVPLLFSRFGAGPAAIAAAGVEVVDSLISDGEEDDKQHKLLATITKPAIEYFSKKILF